MPPGVPAPPRPPTLPATPVAADTRDTVAAIYRAHARELWRVLGRLGVPPAAVEDALHDLFIVVQRKLPGFEHRAALRTWLYAIAVRIARRYRERLRRDAHDPEQDVVSPARPPDRALLDAEAVRVLDELLSRLPEAKREVFVLHEVEELSAPQIATILGINLNTVYSRLREARKAFVREHSRHRFLGGDAP
ncbi:RNA polymerase sigma factor [Nannocystis punicea]|uniref:RNA polymerase sigma factor n=1 Tax=Nannocystis punicea TaxID=2995304 RepID=A0ABY7GWT3_9BACT|nr:RNA polymerase sigma factor [Nannocystis poenicansa]WAS91422.1 RNA polymerase sigma factor [Nannocystis poenicansa]